MSRRNMSIKSLQGRTTDMTLEIKLYKKLSYRTAEKQRVSCACLLHMAG